MNPTFFKKSPRYLFFFLLGLVSNYLNAQAPVANFTANRTSGCSPLTVAFRDASTGTPTSWTWDLGNGTISNQQNPTASYTAPGTYEVTLVVRNADGVAREIKTNFITVNASPVANFTADRTQACLGSSIRFTDTSTDPVGNIVSWLWNFGDGTSSTAQHPVKTYDEPGFYSASLQVTSSSGCVHTRTLSNIRILAGITSAFVAIPDSICRPPFSIPLLNETAGPGTLTYVWDFGNGTSSVAAAPTAMYNAGGTYTISLTTTSQYGCSDRISQTVTINGASPSISRPASICLNEPATFTNTSTPGFISSNWQFGDGAISSAASPSHTFSQPGTYNLKLITDFGYCIDSVEQTINVNSLPAVDFTADEQSYCEAPFAVQFTAVAPDAVSWSWNFGNGNTSTQRNPTHTYLTEGSFNVTLTITNADGCSNTIVKPAFINIQEAQIAEQGLRANGCIPFNYTPNANITTLAPVTSWRWNFGDGSAISTTANPTHQYTSAGNYNVTLTITTLGGCEVSRTVTNAVRVGVPATPDFTVADQEVCLSTPVTFNNTSLNSDQWTWDFGDGNTSTQRNPQHRYESPGVYNIRLTAFNNGCPRTITRNAYITIPPPQARFTFNSNCGTNFLTFNFSNSSIVNPAALPISYTWDFGVSGATSTAENPSYTFPTTGTYPVTLTVTNGACTHSVTHNVWVSNEMADFTLSSTDICKYQNVTISATNSNAALIRRYTWTIDNGAAFQAPRSFDTTFTDNGVHSIRLTILDNNNCSHTIERTNALTVRGPQASFSTSTLGTCVQTPVEFTDASVPSNDIIRRRWSMGDGTVIANGTAQTSYSYNRPGNFTPTLVVEDNRNCTDTFRLASPIVITGPVADFSVSETTFCPKLPLAFTNASSGSNLSYLWSFGDGNESQLPNPEHLYNDVDQSYSVTLVVTDQQGCEAEITKSNYLTAITPKASFTVSDSVFLCTISEVTFTNQSTDYLSLSWDFANGNVSTRTNPVQFFNSRGTYLTTLTAVGHGGCVDIAEQSIRVVNPNAVQILYPDPAIACNELLVDFDIVLPDDQLSFTFNFGDNTRTTDQNPQFSHLYNFPSLYRPSISMADRHGCTASVQVPLNRRIQIQGAVPAFSASQKEFCDEGTVAFTDFTISPQDRIESHLWTFGTAGTSTDQNPEFTFTEPGLYPIVLAVTTETPCTSYFYDTILIYRTPVPVVSLPASICVNDIIDFTTQPAVADTALRWNWTFSNNETSTAQSPAIRFNTSGEFQYSVTVANYLNCTTTLSETFTVNPLPEINVPGEVIVPSGSSVQLPVTYSDNVINWIWQPVNNLNCTDCAQPVANPQFSTVYKVTVTDDNGCKQNAEVPVRVVCNNLNFFVPNTFSPNNDGVNDVFYPRGRGIERIASMRIYNRWGEMVFEKRNFPANNAADGWRGDMKGKPAASGTYIYSIELICENALVIPYKGNITLIR